MVVRRQRLRGRRGNNDPYIWQALLFLTILPQAVSGAEPHGRWFGHGLFKRIATFLRLPMAVGGRSLLVFTLPWLLIATIPDRGSGQPSAPTDFKVTATDATSITLGWDGGSVPTGYVIQWHAGADAPATWPAPVTTGTEADGKNAEGLGDVESFVHSGLTTGTKYHYRLWEEFTDTWSGNVSGTAEASLTALPKPENVVTKPGTVQGNGKGSLTLEWDLITGTRYSVRWDENEADLPDEDNLKVIDATVHSLKQETLVLGSSRYYQVKATSLTSDAAKTASSWTDVIEGVAGGTLDPVEGLILTITTGTAVITWDRHEIATSYTVEYEKDGSFVPLRDVPQVRDDPTVSTEQYNRIGNTTYDYRVRANHTDPGVEESPWETANAMEVVAEPKVVAGFEAAAISDTEITLSWTASTATDVAFDIEHNTISATEADAEWIVTDSPSSGSTSYPHTGLTEETQYWYRIRAKRLGVVGDWSIVATATTTAAGVAKPDTISDFTARAVKTKAGEILLAWSPPTDSDGEIDSVGVSYDIEHHTDATTADWITTVTAPVGVNHSDHVGLVVGTTYYYRIRASKGGVKGDWTKDDVSATALATPGAPGVPTNLNAERAADTTVTLTWEAPSVTGSSAITGYKIEQSADGVDFTLIETVGNVLTYLHEDATAETIHYRVLAVNTAGDSPPSNTDFVTKVGAEAPSAPTNLAAVAAVDGITLTWDAPSEPGSSPITSYQIQDSADAGGAWDDLDTTLPDILTYLHDAAPAGKTTHYRVFAVNDDAGRGPASNIDDAMMAGIVKLSAPTNLTATRSGTEINLSWTAPSGMVAGYRIGFKHDAATPVWSGLEESHTETTYKHTGVEDAKRYEYQVLAIGTDGSDGDPATVVVEAVPDETTPTPGAPTGLTATRSGTEINLSWTAPSGTVTGYKIEVKIDAAAWRDQVESQTATTYKHTGVEDAKRYQYRVSAINADVTGPVSNIANVEPVPDETVVKPGAPTGLTASRSHPNINLSWTKPSGTVTGYKIEVLIGSGSWSVHVGNTGTGTTSYTHASTDREKRYRYRVSAINAGGTGVVSNIANVAAEVEVDRKPGAPRNLTATANAEGISLNWSAPVSAGSSAINNYRVERSANGSSWSLLTTLGTTTSYFHAVRAGLRVYYRVFAINDEGDSPASNTADAIRGVRKPSAPRSLSARVQINDISLSWRTPSDTGTAAVTDYRVERSANGSSGWSVLATVSGTTYLHTGVSASTTVYYRVFAINSAGDSPASNTVSAKTERDVPTAPRSLTASVATGGIVLAWAAPSDEGSAPLTEYRIEQSANGLTGWRTLTAVDPTVTDYIHDAGPSTTVHYRVFALNEHGVSPASNTANAKTGRDIPTAPRNLSVEAERDGNRLRWTPPSDSGSASITSYRVERSMDTGASWTALVHADATATSFLHRIPPPGQEIHYRVIATNDHGDGPASNTVSIRTAANPPSRPGNLRASTSGATILLTWNEPRDDGGAEVTGYQIDVATNGVWSTLIDNTETTETSYTHQAKPGSVLSYRAYAINAAGRGPSSNVIRVIVEATVPSEPLGVGALAQSHKAIGLAWNPPTDDGGSPVTGYRIETSDDGVFWSVLSSNFAATSTSYRHINLKPATRHHYRVFAINKVGRSGPSEIVNAMTLATLPEAPERLTVNAVSATQIDLVWNEPRITGGIKINRYIVETSSDGAGWRFLVETVGTETSYQHRELQPSTIYYYRVSAENDIGRSLVSRSAYTQTKAAVPDAPTALLATVRSSTEIYLTWVRPQFDGGLPITGYILESSLDNGSSWKIIRANTGSSNTAFAHTGLTRGTLYQYRVAAINKIGTGAISEVIEVKTFAVVPDAPFDLEAEPVSSSQIELSWSAPEDDGGAPITRYQVQTLEEGDWTRLADVDRGLKYSHEDVTAGETWIYRVIARNEAGYGPPSESVSATTDDPIERTERVVNALLPRFMATAMSSSLRAITSRINLIATGEVDTRINVMGGRDGLRGIMNGSVVTQPLHSGTAIWASADLTGMSEIGEVDWSGDVFSLHGGLDGMLRDNILVGIAGGRSRGGFNFTDQMGGQDTEGDFNASLTSINPYLAWLKKDVGVWIAGGEGWGEFDLQDEITTKRSSRMTSSMIAVGGFSHLLTSPVGSFQLLGEAMSARIEVTGNNPEDDGDEIEEDHIAGSSLRLRRGRAMLDWTVPRKVYGVYSADVHFQGGIRYDYNEHDTGVGGTELGGGIKLAGPIFRIHGSGRIFIHPEYREWGIRGLIELRSHRGLGMNVRSSYGDTGDGLTHLWENGVQDDLEPRLTQARLDAAVQYKLSNGSMPYWRIDLLDGRRNMAAGVSYRLDRLDIRSEATRRAGVMRLNLHGRIQH